MTRVPEVTFSRETVQALREFLGRLPEHPAFHANEWNGDVAAAAAANWISTHPREAAALVAALANLFAHAQRAEVG